MRVSAVLPALMAEHEVMLFCGGDAKTALAMQPQFDLPLMDIPVVAYRYGRNGHISVANTIAKNWRIVSDILLGNGRYTAKIQSALESFQPDLIISDSEPWLHQAARRMEIPRIGFDHVGIIAYCKPRIDSSDWFNAQRDAIGYRALMGVPERILLSSFYPAIPRRADIAIIPPLMREEVTQVEPGNDQFLLVYFNKGEHQFLPAVEAILRAIDMPLKVYGTQRALDKPVRDGNLTFCPRSNLGFLQDLSRCHAVISTAGNQLIGESIFFGKPILAMPEDAFEQRLNATMVEHMGIGMRNSWDTIGKEDLDEFLNMHDSYTAAMATRPTDGKTEALQRLQQFITELSPATSTSILHPNLHY